MSETFKFYWILVLSDKGCGDRMF